MMEGKICLVTGATSGIGLEIATGLVEQGATVIITGRNEELGERIVQDLKERTGNGFIELMIADFSSQKEIRKLAKRVKSRYDQLNILVNNAGLYQPDFTLTEDNIEQTFAVNYLAPFILSHELLELLQKGHPARIINMSSSFHKRGFLDFSDLNLSKKYNGMQAYMNSKLALVMFTYFFAKKVESMGITVNAVHPGIVKTNLPRAKSFYSFLLKASPFFISAKKGAETPLYLATAKEVEHITGKYFVKKKIQKTKQISYDEEMQKRLWETSLKLAKIKRPKV